MSLSAAPIVLEIDRAKLYRAGETRPFALRITAMDSQLGANKHIECKVLSSHWRLGL